MIVPRPHPSELAWARHLSGEAGWLATRRMRRHLAACASCREFESELAQERRVFDADPLRREELALLQTRAAASTRNRVRSRSRRAWMVAGGALAAALVAIGVRPPTPRLAAKGQDVFTVFVERPSGAVALGARCAPGDRLIARFRSERRYLLLLERDGRGAVQVLAPPGGAASMPLAAGEGTTPASWILDDARGRECFVAVFSDAPVGRIAASEAIARSPDGPVLPGAVVRVSCCEKEVPP